MKQSEYNLIKNNIDELKKSPMIAQVKIKTIGGKRFILGAKERVTIECSGGCIEFTDSHGQEWSLEKNSIAKLQLVPTAKGEAAITSQK